MKPLRIPSAGLLLAFAGCVTVQKVQPAAFLSTHSPDVVWVTTNDNARTPVAQAQIVGDVLQGTKPGCDQPVAISLKDINYVQATLPARKRTALLVTAAGVAVIGMAFTLAPVVDKTDAVTVCRHTPGTPDDYCGAF